MEEQKYREEGDREKQKQPQKEKERQKEREKEKEKDKEASRSFDKFGKESPIEIQFVLIEKNWTFIHFSHIFTKTDPFLVIEQKIKNFHGSIKNLQMFYESSLKKKIDYHFRDPLESKLNMFNLAQGLKQPKIIIYYRFDNGYEWPLLS